MSERSVNFSREAIQASPHDKLRKLFGEVPGADRGIYRAKEYKTGRAQYLDSKDIWLRKNEGKIRAVIESGFVVNEQEPSKEEWLTEALYSFSNFRNLKFHGAGITCTGADLLEVLGINNKKEFDEFTRQVFPEQGATLLLARHDTRPKPLIYNKDSRATIIKNSTNRPAIRDDLSQIIQGMGEDSQSPGVNERLAQFLFGKNRDEIKEESEDFDNLEIHIRSSVDQVDLDPRQRKFIALKFLEEPNLTLKEIGELETPPITKEAVRKILEKALLKIRKKILADQERRPQESIETGQQ